MVGEFDRDLPLFPTNPVPYQEYLLLAKRLHLVQHIDWSVLKVCQAKIQILDYNWSIRIPCLLFWYLYLRCRLKDKSEYQTPYRPQWRIQDHVCQCIHYNLMRPCKHLLLLLPPILIVHWFRVLLLQRIRRLRGRQEQGWNRRGIRGRGDGCFH